MNKFCGFIALIGKPNVGKSTLLNALLQQKISITSHRPQTTRLPICGIKTVDNTQMIYVDTPGIHRLKDIGEKKLNQYMNRAATRVMAEVDIILFLIESKHFNAEDERVLSLLEKTKLPVILVINKIDQLKHKEDLLPFIHRLSSQYPFVKIVPISAIKRLQLDVLETQIINLCPEGPFHYPEETLCNRPESFRLAEMLREKVMRLLDKEVPYATTVQIEDMQFKDNIYYIHALIWVEKLGQKTILIGPKGAMLKTIGSQARLDMERLLGKKVMLKLWVKVKRAWSDNQVALSDFGLADERCV